MELLEYLRSKPEEKNNILNKEGIILDTEIENGLAVILYFVNYFFVEVTIDIENDRIVDLIPYKRGFRLPRGYENGMKNKERTNDHYFLL
jgi:hypothetical protein